MGWCLITTRSPNPSVPVNLIIKMLHEWLVLQINPKNKKLMLEGVRRIEALAGEVFKATLGWRATRRIAAY